MKESELRERDACLGYGTKDPISNKTVNKLSLQKLKSFVFQSILSRK
jgi:hypothetical protein